MERWRIKINQLLVEPVSTRKRTLTRTFTTKPAADLEQKYGRLFGIFEITSSEGIAEQLVQLIVEELRTNFYYAPKPGALSDALSLEETLERALQKANSAIAAFLESEQVTIDVDHLNLCVGCATTDAIHFAFTGKMNVFLIHPAKNGQNRIVNILDGSASSAGPANPLKLFSQIMSGRIRPQDTMVFTTPNVLDYFSLDRIKNILTASHVVDGLGKLKDLFPKANLQEHFAVLTLELETVVVPPPKPTPIATLPNTGFQQRTYQDSMQELIKTESQTEKLLSPTILPELSQTLGGAWSSLRNRFSSGSRTSQRSSSMAKVPPSSPLTQRKPQSSRSWNSLWGPVQRRLRRFPSLPQIPGLRLAKQLLLSSARPFLRWFSQLPKKNKLIFALGAIGGLILIGGVGIQTMLASAAAQRQALADVITEATQKKQEAEASLIYRDEGLARAQLIEAREQLLALNLKDRVLREQRDQVIGEINTQLQKLQHLETIAEPVVIANLLNLDAEAALLPALWYADNTVSVVNLHQPAVYRVTLSDRQIGSTPLDPAPPANLRHAVLLRPNQVLAFDTPESGTLITLSTGKTTAQPVTLPNGAVISDSVAYLDRLYLLDRQTGQVWRYPTTAAGLRANPTAWIKDPNALVTGGSSITVDGSLFAVANTTVSRFESGAPVAFSLQTIDPALAAPTKIRTTQTSRFIYLLDPASKRLVVVTKEGVLAAQYTSPQFTTLTDLAIDEAGRRAFLLNGTTIYGVPLSHL